MITKQDLQKWAAKEFATTLKVLRAYPDGQEHLKPSEHSRSAVDIAKTFVFEMYLLETFMFGDVLDRAKFKTYNPADFSALIADFEKHSSQVLERLEKLPEADLSKTAEFGGRKFLLDEFAFMMVLDQIHHRGQLSIYVRLAGGKIPSIYGPTADDPTTNL